ncbi:MAG TPA: cytochrome d ubiquinol oxidase subunit II [Gemmatimonadaceae bacterium]|nr:cytochrome d ubiquinol oxidase subunit II [Gemmatimonadaceae bacterium]
MTFTLAIILAGIVMVALNAYVLLAGADFGGGVWDFFARGDRRQAQRDLISHAIAPIWEANHVWLILVIVLLFTCFPAAFSTIAILLHIPLTLMLLGIVLRGSAFIFRSYGSERDVTQQRWGRVFAIASIATPVLLGMCVGAVATGAVGATVVSPSGSFVSQFIRPWLTMFGVGVGLLALALFSFLAAVYLTVEAEGTELQEDFRTRALWSAGAVFVLAFGVLALSWTEAPMVRRMLMAGPWALPLHIVTGIAAITAIVALWTRRFRLARVAAAAQVTFILWGWAAAQYPYLLPPTLTIEAAAAPNRTLVLILWALAAGACVLLPSLYYLFRIFKLQRRS